MTRCGFCTGWTPEDLAKTAVILKSTYGDSHPGSGHLNVFVEESQKRHAEEAASARGISVRTFATGSQGTEALIQPCQP